ncbi:class I SAM-dependent methyltransferase [Candidatus Leptofilum sp.]|uniref:class I SAM-dependent methyltransferase n=1 Tax=Candidatus Leptofilum sp. TaxID=3241576 RepID=UPI003B5A09BE
MTIDSDAVGEYWSKRINSFSGKNTGQFWWDAGPEIYDYRNTKISGDPSINWTEYTLKKYFDEKLPLTRCLSLGCGGGRLERQLAELGTFQHCDAYDVAEGAVQQARELASTKGINNISYHVADINTISLSSDTYDAVWISMAMHHFQELEHVCKQIKNSLKPEGLLILEEYIGPNRFQFPERQKEVANLCLSLLPSRYRLKVQHATNRESSFPVGKGMIWFMSRLVDKIKDGDLLRIFQRRLFEYRSKISGQIPEKRVVNFPSALDVIAVDPSEAIRSEEIVDVLQQDFEIIEKKDWGGNILHSLLADIAGNFSSEDQHSRAFLKMLINIEDTFLECGEFESDFAYIVARPMS